MCDNNLGNQKVQVFFDFRRSHRVKRPGGFGTREGCFAVQFLSPNEEDVRWDGHGTVGASLVTAVPVGAQCLKRGWEPLSYSTTRGFSPGCGTVADIFLDRLVMDLVARWFKPFFIAHLAIPTRGMGTGFGIGVVSVLGIAEPVG